MDVPVLFDFHATQLVEVGRMIWMSSLKPLGTLVTAHVIVKTVVVVPVRGWAFGGTVTVPVMLWWMWQWYANFPAPLNANENVAPGDRLPEFHSVGPDVESTPLSVVVWVTLPLLVQVTDPPRPRDVELG